MLPVQCLLETHSHTGTVLFLSSVPYLLVQLIKKGGLQKPRNLSKYVIFFIKTKDLEKSRKEILES